MSPAWPWLTIEIDMRSVLDAVMNQPAVWGLSRSSASEAHAEE